MSVQQALIDTQFGTSLSFTFTTDLQTHDSVSAGSNPTAGNTLLIICRALFGGDITDIDTNQNDATSFAANTDYTADAAGFPIIFYRIENISAGVTQIDVTCDANATVWLMVIEETDTFTLNDTSDLGAQTFQTTILEEYTTSIANELVLAWVESGLTRDHQDSDGSTVTALSGTETYSMAYKVVASAETNDLEVLLDSGANAAMALVSYQPVAGGGEEGESFLVRGHPQINRRAAGRF